MDREQARAYASNLPSGGPHLHQRSKVEGLGKKHRKPLILGRPFAWRSRSKVLVHNAAVAKRLSRDPLIKE